ncbi:MAG: (Na+)-NQR maturation NqrM [Pseudomonadota bacterium]|nr:(Na+)-NQR maturation NqrM [Pseudomonadota bacterium]
MLQLALTLTFMLLIFTALSIGVLMGRKPISGSCGGLNALDGNGKCSLCGGTPDDCDRPAGPDLSDQDLSPLGYEVTERKPSIHRKT